MSLIKWSDKQITPFSDAIGDLDQFFDSPIWTKTVRLPEMDVYQDNEHVYVKVAVPGISPEQIKVRVDGNILTIAAENRKQSEIEEKTYYRKEIKIGSFQRSVELPSNVVSDKAEANYKDGILKIIMPKLGEKKMHEIKINHE